MEKRIAILDAAGPLFARYGLKKVTTDDIARAARVSKATVYRFYANKREILREIVRREVGDLMERLREAISDESTAEGRLRAHLLTKINAIHDFVNLHQMTSATLQENWSYAEELRRDYLQKETALIEEILRDGVRSGELDVPDPRINAHFMVLAMQTLEKPWAIEGFGLDVAGQVDLMLRTLMNGYRIRSEGE